MYLFITGWMVILEENVLKILSDPDVIASVIGGLVGGLFTYLAVILTFNKQKKDELPAKLLALTEMNSTIETYEKNLKEYLDIYLQLSESKARLKVNNLDLGKLQSTLIPKALIVDKETYKMIRESLQIYFLKNYHEITEFGEDEDFFDKSTYAAVELIEDLPILREKLSIRIAYYEKKLR